MKAKLELCLILQYLYDMYTDTRLKAIVARYRELYIDHTPPPTAEEIELRRMQRLSMPPRRARGAGAPKKRERRDLRRLKEGSD